jgi:2Fe-2S ferredoxin
VPEGGLLVAICDAARLPVPFSCRSASCGTCHVRVLEGSEFLEPKEEAERDLLAFLSAREDTRLACQARVRPGAGLIRLEPC